MPLNTVVFAGHPPPEDAAEPLPPAERVIFIIKSLIYRICFFFLATRMGILGMKRVVVPPKCLANRFGKI